MKMRFPSWKRWAWLLLLLPVTTVFGAWIIDGSRFPDGAAPVEKSFPVLVLELGGQWTDFELKASTDNFESVVYIVKSSETNVYADDPGVWVFYTDDFSLTPRKWLKAEVATPIGSQLVDPAQSEITRVVVIPSHETAVDWSLWMFEGNSGLVWSYARFDGVNFEMNAAGTGPKWRPVVPVLWRTERVSP